MKKFLTAAMALTVLGAGFAGTANAATHDRYRDNDRNGRYEQHHDRYDQRRNNERFHAGKYHAPPGYQNHKWRKGDRLPAAYRGRSYVITQPSHYHLAPAPRGYEWTRVGNDAVLTAVATGVIAAIAVSLFAN